MSLKLLSQFISGQELPRGCVSGDPSPRPSPFEAGQPGGGGTVGKFRHVSLGLLALSGVFVLVFYSLALGKFPFYVTVSMFVLT